MDNPQRSISLLELGVRSTEFYLDLLKKSASDASIQRVSVDFERLNGYLPDNFTYLAPQLEKALEQCRQGDSIIIPNITLHETLDYQCEECTKSRAVVHPLKESALVMGAAGISEAVVFGSGYTMQSSYIREFFIENGIKVVSPHPDDARAVDRFRVAVYRRLETNSLVATFQELVKKYADRAVVIIACTELSILLDESLLSDSIFDLARIQIAASIEPDREG